MKQVMDYRTHLQQKIYALMLLQVMRVKVIESVLKHLEKKKKLQLNIHPFKYFYSERSCFSFSAKKVIKRLISKSDLVHVNGIFTHPATLGARYARLAGKPHIVAIRNGLDPWMMKIKRMKKLIGFHLYVKADLKGATCIHATSRQEVEACQKMGIKGSFTIIPNGINPSEYENLQSEDSAEKFWPFLRNRKIVLFLGRLSKEKGLDMLISCLEPNHKKAYRFSPCHCWSG